MNTSKFSDQLSLQLLRSRQESPERIFLLGFLHYAGVGVRQDYTAALKHFVDAGEHGLSWAEHAAGFMYETGKGTEKDLRAAIVWYRRAADRSHAPALCALALILKFGPDDLRDQPQAFDLFTRAAGLGNCMAALQAADSLERGLGVERDEAAARDWYFRAAEISDESTAAAHAAVASLYRDGRLGVSVDSSKAEQWAESSRNLLRAQGPGG